MKHRLEQASSGRYVGSPTHLTHKLGVRRRDHLDADACIDVREVSYSIECLIQKCQESTRWAHQRRALDVISRRIAIQAHTTPSTIARLRP